MVLGVNPGDFPEQVRQEVGRVAPVLVGHGYRNVDGQLLHERLCLLLGAATFARYAAQRTLDIPFRAGVGLTVLVVYECNRCRGHA